MQFASFLLSALLAGPHSEPSTQETPASKLSVELIASPAGSGSRCPRLSVGPTGRIYLSWLQEGGGSDASGATLRFARLEGSQWSPAREIAHGTRWFLNWADFPSLAVLDDGHLLAHFLQKSSEGTYDYHVQLARSGDGGESWSEAVRLHSDGGAGEHGFVSLVRRSSSSATAVWLDGRNAKGADEHTGSMSLYARSIGSDGELGNEVLLDERVCDCCQTSAVTLSDGAVLVAYRDRSDDEVRDISIVRLAADGALQRLWSSRDGWKIRGCPVNGPVLAAAGDRIAIAWFTLGSDGSSRVSCAFSNDTGKSFSAPTKLAGEGASGRVDAVFDDRGRLVVTWLQSKADRTEWRVARVERDGRVLDDHAVAETSLGRDGGLARLARDSRGIVFAYTDPGAESRVATLRLAWEPKENH